MKETNGLIYVALVVIVLMGAVIASQQMMIDGLNEKTNTRTPAAGEPINMTIISYGPGLEIVDRQVLQMTPLGTVNLATDSWFVCENDVIIYSVRVEY